MKTYYQNNECGNILTFGEMLEEGREMYDLNDITNICGYFDYYTPVKLDWE